MKYKGYFENYQANSVRMLGEKLLIRIPILILFVYQFYDLIDNYFRYDYSFQLDFDTSSKILPSITICLEEKNNFTHLFENFKKPFGNKTIICYYNDNWLLKNYDCKEEKVYMRYRHKDICLTFLNRKNNFYEKLLSNSIQVYFTSFMFSRQTKIIHPPDTASHFELNNVFVSKSGEYKYFIISKVTKLTLPKPYSTDCHDYSDNQLIQQTSRSQSYCMLEYMKIKELNKCGKSIYWNQLLIYNENQIFNYNGNYSDECIVKMNYKLLSRICKIDCLSVSYKVKSDMRSSDRWNPIIGIPLPRKYNINLLYEPKLTIVIMFSNLGGLISMYFGLSMVELGRIAHKIFIKIINMRKIKLTIAIFSKFIKNIDLFYNDLSVDRNIDNIFRIQYYY